LHSARLALLVNQLLLLLIRPPLCARRFVRSSLART
jgi:hypothetical protein